jgi:hypothetical protein
VKCKDFRHWLDSGRTDDPTGAAISHAESCAACRREMEGSTALDAALADVSVPSTAAFVSSVMAQVARTPQVRPTPALPPVRQWLPWWVQAAAQPTVVLAFAIISLILWQGDTLFAAAAGLGTWLGAQGAAAGFYLGSLGDPAHRLYVWSGLILGFSPLLAFLYLWLYRGSLTLMLRLSGAAPSLARR